MKPLTSTQHFQLSHRRLAAANEAALHILPSITLAEFDRLVAKNPRTWERFRPLAQKLCRPASPHI